MIYKIMPNGRVNNFLDKKIVKTKKYVDIDRWVFVHLISGFVLYMVFPNPIKIVFVLMIYKLFEYLFAGVFWKRETPANMVWDVMAGMTGMLIGIMVLV